MMVVFKYITTFGGNGVKLMVWQMGECATRYAQSVIELIVGIIHLIDTEDGFQTTLVEWLVMSYKRQPLDERFYLRPYFREDGSLLGILTA